MPKLIDYPRTSYTGAWELAEIVDETGGKCSIENAAKKMDRKVSGSFKAIIGSSVKFGLVTSKRELLSTTTLFKRIKHAYDKEEEMQFHREAFLAPPLFTQLCRKFRNRELPVQMLDVMLMREFNVEEINAQAVAKLFVDGCHMSGILDEGNMMADIDTLNNKAPKRTLGSPTPPISSFHPATLTGEMDLVLPDLTKAEQNLPHEENPLSLFGSSNFTQKIIPQSSQTDKLDAVASLFNLPNEAIITEQTLAKPNLTVITSDNHQAINTFSTSAESLKPIEARATQVSMVSQPTDLVYTLSVIGPGINTSLDLTEAVDVEIALALLEKIRRRFRNK